MSQIIHIFKKDLKRFSWEIVLSMLLLVFYAWCQPVLWRPFGSLSYGGTITALRYTGAATLGMLLLLGWMVVLVRLIYEESLTGDRQFWVTRPYRWQSLLAAKVLFVFIVINLPLFVAQLCLVAAAGFAPFQHVSRVLGLNLTLAVLLLPLATLAVVTGGKRQMTRAIIMLLIFLVASVWLAQSFYGFFFAFDVRGAGSGRTGTWQWLVWAVMVGVAIVVIVRQYALRKTAQARWILIGAGLALILMAAAEPKYRFPEAEYPLLGNGADGYFEIKMPTPEKPHAGHLYVGRGPEQGKKTVWITLKFTGGEVAEGLVAQAEAIKLTFQAPDGAQWNSDWQAVSAVLSHNDSGTIDASGLQLRSLVTYIPVDWTFFDKFKDVPINLQVEIASTLYRDHAGAPFIPKQDEFKIQNVGTCVVSQVSEILLSCRSPLAGIPMVGVSVRLFNNCSAEDDSYAPIYQSYAWWPDSEQWSGEFGLNPVRQFELSASHEVAGQALTACANSTFTVHQPAKIRGYRIQKDFSGVKLADLVLQQ
jgi:hypothetical protein